MSDTPEVVILIVDDKEQNLVALERILREVPARVVRATTGEEALTHTLHHDFSLAILDVQMPGMDGYELAELMLGDPLTSRIPIIFVTAAYGDEQHLFKGYMSGAVDYLIKPFNPMVLLGKVRVFLELARYRLELEKLVDQRTSALRSSEAQYRGLIDNACDLIQCVRLNHTIEFVNPTWSRVLGYRGQDLENFHIASAVAPECRQDYLRLVERVHAGDMDLGFHTTLISRDGRRVLVEGNIVPHVVDGQVRGSQAFLRDITARRDAEQRLELAVQGSGALLWDWMLEQDTVCRTGGAGVLLTGIAGGLEHRMSLARWESHIHPEDQRRRRDLLDEHFLRRTDHYECELRMQDGMGGWHWALDYGKVFEWDAEGQPRRMAGTLIDISMRKLAEAERSRVLRAEAENHAKSSFLASMSHEMRTPLNAILGYAQLLGHDSGLSPRQRDSLDTILRSGDHLLSLINEVLDLAQIESGHMKVVSAEVDLRQLLVDLERMFRLKVTERGVGLRVDGLDKLPRRVLTDARKVRQVLINLLGNAVKFTERGGIAVRISHEALTASRRRVSIQVEDTGCGIEAEKLESIFESFVQAEAGSRTLGAGLGLAVSRQLAQALEGGVEATSTLGVGSNFRFHFVVQCPDTDDLQAGEGQAMVVGLASANRGFPVLVVDSQSESRALLGGLLGAVGFALREAVQLDQALVALEVEKPGVVLWAQGSRKSTAMGSLETLSKSCAERGVPLVALLSSEAHAQEAQPLAQATLLLPLREQELFTAIESLCGVEFLRSGESDQEVRGKELEDAEDAIRALPKAERAELSQAVEDGFTDLIERLITQVENPRAAAHLASLTQNFDYTRLLALLNHESHDKEGPTGANA